MEPQELRRKNRRAVPVAILIAGMCGAIAYRLQTQRPAGILLDSSAIRVRLDPNVASVGELACIPGVGPSEAGKIVEYRKSHGAKAFGCLSDLDRVPGLGPRKLEQASEYLVFPTGGSK